MEWSAEKVVQLIKAYRALPILYDTTRIDYKDKTKKRDALDSLARALDCDVREIEKKIHNLRGQFQRERVKLLRTSATSGFVVEPRWFAYKHLKFLIKYNSLRSSSSRDVLSVTQNVILDHEHDMDSSPSLDSDNFGRTSSQDDYSEPSHVRPLVFASHSSKIKNDDNNTAPEVTSQLNPTRSPSGPSKPRDEYTVYGEYVGMRMRKIRDQRSLSVLQHLINTALFEAEMGLYRNESNPRGLAVCVLSDPSNFTRNTYQSQDYYDDVNASPPNEPSRSSTPSSTYFEVKPRHAESSLADFGN